MKTYAPFADLTILDVVEVARHGARIEPLVNGPEVERVRRSAAWVEASLEEVEIAALQGREAAVYYGINTGFGDNAGRATFKKVQEAEMLSRKILLSHTVGVGEHLPAQ